MRAPDGLRLLPLALVLEGALALFALGLGWWFLDDPLPSPVWPDQRGLWWALGGSLALTLAALGITSRAARRVGWIEGINRGVTQSLGPAIGAASVSDLLLVSLAAGVGEELLFRGVLQPLWGLWPTALVFGLAHALTPAYFGLAVGMGLLLGWLSAHTGGLFAPMAVHAVYDAVALLRLRRRMHE
ncbi:MAG: CPBP family intramembrane metalloprotease [Planctomycetota bacterium]|nr:MAG: CPBP family intramembrane metalloprotease [Planctomycetota bacterium]